MKVCSKCGIEKEFSEFYKDKQTKDGFRSYCIICSKELSKKYRENNKESIKECNKKYRENNKEKISIKQKEYYENNIEKFKERDKIYYENNKEKLNQYLKQYNKNNKEKLKDYKIQYYENNKEKLNQYLKQYNKNNKEKRKEYYKKYRENNKDKIKDYRENNKESIKESWKEYYENNKDKIKEYKQNNKYKTNKHINNRRKTDPLFKMSCNLRSRTCAAFKTKSWSKNNTTQKILGCDFETAHKHLEKQFIKGMSWENHSEWHIDHIIPLASAKTESELIKLCHYTNLQPLWAIDNMKKGATMPNVQTQLRI